MAWFVYVLRCADDSLYTGITTDVERRLHEHNCDDQKAARYTRSRRPLQLFYQEACADRAAAARREYQVKRLSRPAKLQLKCALTSGSDGADAADG